MIADDPQIYLTMLGNCTVALGSESTTGIAEHVEERVQINDAGASSVIEHLAVLIETDALENLEVGSILTLTGLASASVIPTEGRTVEVRERYRIHEGRMTQLYCRELT